MESTGGWTRIVGGGVDKHLAYCRDGIMVVQHDDQLSFLLNRELQWSEAFCDFEFQGEGSASRSRMRTAYNEEGRILVTSRYGHYSHTDNGVEVRRDALKQRGPCETE